MLQRVPGCECRHPSIGEQSSLLENFDSIALSSQCVSAVRTGQQSHHFIERSNVELWHRAGVLQSVLHPFGGIEQFQSNVVVVSPSLEKHEHAQTTAFYGRDQAQ